MKVPVQDAKCKTERFSIIIVSIYLTNLRILRFSCHACCHVLQMNHSGNINVSYAHILSIMRMITKYQYKKQVYETTFLLTADNDIKKLLLGITAF